MNTSILIEELNKFISDESYVVSKSASDLLLSTTAAIVYYSGLNEEANRIIEEDRGEVDYFEDVIALIEELLLSLGNSEIIKINTTEEAILALVSLMVLVTAYQDVPLEEVQERFNGKILKMSNSNSFIN